MDPAPLALLKGTLDVLILRTLAAEPMHGYAISKWIRERSGELFRVEEGALYPALRRLEQRGYLEGEWATSDTGREARYYTLTKDGRRHLSAELTGWNRYVDAMARVLRAEG
jgi:transcriptional regulator